MATAPHALPQAPPAADPTLRWRRVLAVLLAALVASWLAFLMVGERFLDPSAIARTLARRPATRLDEIAVWQVRFPRSLLAIGAGGMLGMAGALLQALVRNPLAAPEFTGVSAGAVAGAVLWLAAAGTGAGAGSAALVLPVAATLGGTAAALAVYGLSRRFGRTESDVLILTGVVVGGVLGALTTVVLLFTAEENQRYLGWIIGSLDLRSWPQVRVLLPAVLVSLPLLIVAIPAANLLQLGDDVATGLGWGAERARVVVLTAAVVLTAGAVSVVGALGFVGLVAPHVARLLAGGDARRLVPSSGLVGATLLLLADTLARTFRLSWLPPFGGNGVGSSALPVGVFTTLLGAPFFLYLLLRRR